jgi:hypothetical protein
MNNRLPAILIVVCFSVAAAGCASERQRQRNQDEILLPRQTGSNLSRRMFFEDENSFKETKKKRQESKQAAKKRAKTERTEPEKAKEPKPDQPEETTPPPDRFR